MKFDEGILEDLKASLDIVGQIYSVLVCKQHPARVLAGRHRTEAGMGKPYLLDVEDRAVRFGTSHEEMEQLIIIYSNVQRRVSKEERGEELIAYAKILENQGVPKEEIASKMVSKLSFSEPYILELLPDEYKQKAKAVSPGRPSSSVMPGITGTSTSDPENRKKLVFKSSLRQSLLRSVQQKLPWSTEALVDLK